MSRVRNLPAPLTGTDAVNRDYVIGYVTSHLTGGTVEAIGPDQLEDYVRSQTAFGAKPGQTVWCDYSIPAGEISYSEGPITIVDGAVVTVEAGSVWEVGGRTYTQRLVQTLQVFQTQGRKTVQTDYSVLPGEDVFSDSDVTIPEGVVVTVSPGGSWDISSPPLIAESDQVIRRDTSISARRNGLSVGPVTIACNIVCSVPEGSIWMIL